MTKSMIPDTNHPDHTTANLADLPHDLRFATWGELEAMGIVRMGPANKHTSVVSLPEGWQIERTDHPHWFELLDHNKRSRADIYFCQDMPVVRAFTAMRRRFTTSTEISPEGNQIRVKAMDGNEVLHASPWAEYIPESQEKLAPCATNSKSRRFCESSIESWLTQNFPAWKNCLSYWDLQF